MTQKHTMKRQVFSEGGKRPVAGVTFSVGVYPAINKGVEHPTPEKFLFNPWRLTNAQYPYG